MDKYEAQKKVIAVIDSCTNKTHLLSARQMMVNYRKLYGLNLIDDLCLELRTAYVDKENELMSIEELFDSLY